MPLPSTSQLGRIVGAGRSYQITSNDLLWLARAVACEGGNEAATAWTYAWRFIVKGWRGTLADLVRAHSQPVNPIWDEASDERCVSNPSRCTPAQLERRARCASATWDSLPEQVRIKVLAWARGALGNPAPKATDFADQVVSESFLRRNPNARVVLRDGNWYIAEEPQLPSNHVRVEGGDATSGAGAGVLGALALAAAGWAAVRAYQRKPIVPGLADAQRSRVRYVTPRAGARKASSCPRVALRTLADRASGTFDVQLYDPSRTSGSIGRFRTRYDEDRRELQVTGAFMNEGYEGCGLGTRAYEALAAHACKEGLVLTSDTSLSEYSYPFWKKQEQKGRVVWSEDRQRFLMLQPCEHKDDLGAYGGRRGSPPTNAETRAFWDAIRAGKEPPPAVPPSKPRKRKSAPTKAEIDAFWDEVRKPAKTPVVPVLEPKKSRLDHEDDEDHYRDARHHSTRRGT